MKLWAFLLACLILAAAPAFGGLVELVVPDYNGGPQHPLPGQAAYSVAIAISNSMFVAGTATYNGPLPLAFAVLWDLRDADSGSVLGIPLHDNFALGASTATGIAEDGDVLIYAYTPDTAAIASCLTPPCAPVGSYMVYHVFSTPTYNSHDLTWGSEESVGNSPLPGFTDNLSNSFGMTIENHSSSDAFVYVPKTDSSIPEPNSLVLLATSVGALGLAARRREGVRHPKT